MIQYWWIPFVFLFYCSTAYLSKQNQDFGGKYFWFLVMVGCCPLWAIISRHSKSLIFDSLLYDTIMALSYYIVLVYLGSSSGFTVWQYVGMAMVIAGLFLIR
jgi:hypothetical protein